MTEDAAWRVATRTVLFVLGLLLLAWLMVALQSVLVQVLLAVILSAGMSPLVDALTTGERVSRWRWRPPRALVVLVLYVLLVVAAILLGMLVVPPVLKELEDLVRRVPGYVTAAQGWLRTLAASYPFLAGLDTADGLQQQLQWLAGQLTALLSRALVLVQLAIGILSGALNGILTLILALYMTSDSRRIVHYVTAFLPLERQEQARDVVARIGLRLGGWARGQLLLSAIIGLMTLIGLSAIGVPYAVLLALIAAVGEAIPMVGPIISAVPAIAIATVYSPTMGLLTLGLYVLIQQLENHLIVPKVMSRAVELHPLAVILALLVFGSLFGFVGVLLALPLAAVLAVALRKVRAAWLASAVFSRPAPGDCAVADDRPDPVDRGPR